MKKFVMYPHGGSGNHGCEAIVRTTVEMLKGEKIILFSERPEEDKKYLEKCYVDVQCSQKKFSRGSVGYIRAWIDVHARQRKDAFDILTFAPVISLCNSDTVLLSIGGDNYCYGDNQYIYLVNREARKRGTKTVLWGCSVEPDDISEQMRQDLESYELIVARESITYSVLKEINKKTVLIPDPAFTLPVGQGIWPDGLNRENFIGINLSPLVTKNETKEGITFENYCRLIRGILENTDSDIALIPHVVWNTNDDRKPLQELYCRFRSSGRVYMVRDQNCTQLKEIISKCRIFIGARTHSTIAAYSTCVPTLVLGYSVKARGIARDIFGSEKDYTIAVQRLSDENELYAAFIKMYENEEKIRKYLECSMPDYIEKTSRAAKELNRI